MTWQPPGSKVGLDLGALGALPGVLPGSKVGLNLGATPGVAPFLDGLVSSVQNRWNTSSLQLSTAPVLPWARVDALHQATVANWRRSIARHGQPTLPWAYMPAKRADALTRWQRFMLIAQQLSANWQQLPDHASDARALWSRSLPRSETYDMGFRSPPRAMGWPTTGWRTLPLFHVRAYVSNWTDPPYRRRDWRAPWGDGDLVPWIIVDPPPPPTNNSGWQPPGSKVGLNLGCAIWLDGAHVPLNIGSAACYAVRPWAQRTYVVLNSVSVVRLPDLAPVRVTSLQLSGSIDSPFWSAQLTLEHPDDLALIRRNASGRRKVRITVNGWQWDLVVEDYAYDRQHAAFGAQVTARSATALHAPPYALTSSAEFASARTMAQLFADSLTGTGITPTWDTVDWLVPGGAFSYRDLTPLAAAARVAEAAGAVLVSDRVAVTVRARPRYPVSPWSWSGTLPDVIIPDDLILSEAVQEVSLPVFDQVFVRGDRVGVAATVRRTGSAGTIDAPQVVDALITHADGARERGRNVLSARGEKANVTHVLPLFAPGGQLELIEPLDLAQIEELGATWKGLVRAVTVSAQRDGAKLTVAQSVEIERSYTDAS